MSKADGKISDKEFLAFKEILHEIPQNELKNVLKVYNLAKEDVAGYEMYAVQIATIFENNLHVLENVLDALFHVAKADAPINKNELFFLEKVAGIFGFTAAEFARIRASHMAAKNDDPWLVLGLESGSDIEETKISVEEISCRKPS